MQGKGEVYWKERKDRIKNFWGKGKLISEISEIIDNRKMSILELGCGEGHIIGELQKRNPNANYFGIDISADAIARASLLYPNIGFSVNMLQDYFLATDQKYDLIIASNVFHELFSSYLLDVGSIDFAKAQISKDYKAAFSLLNKGGIFVVLDGIESDTGDEVSFVINNLSVVDKFDVFVSTYAFLEKEYTKGTLGQSINMTSHDFTRFITKLRFVDSANWMIEKKETYQYYTEREFREVFLNSGLTIFKLERFIANVEIWRQEVELLRGEYPDEHIIIMAVK